MTPAAGADAMLKADVSAGRERTVTPLAITCHPLAQLPPTGTTVVAWLRLMASDRAVVRSPMRSNAADFEFIVRAFVEHKLSYSYMRDVFVKMQVGGVSTAGAEARRRINREFLRACLENGIYSNPAMIASKNLLKLTELVRR